MEEDFITFDSYTSVAGTYCPLAKEIIWVYPESSIPNDEIWILKKIVINSQVEDWQVE